MSDSLSIHIGIPYFSLKSIGKGILMVTPTQTNSEGDSCMLMTAIVPDLLQGVYADCLSTDYRSFIFS